MNRVGTSSSFQILHCLGTTLNRSQYKIAHHDSQKEATPTAKAAASHGPLRLDIHNQGPQKQHDLYRPTVVPAITNKSHHRGLRQEIQQRVSAAVARVSVSTEPHPSSRAARTPREKRRSHEMHLFGPGEPPRGQSDLVLRASCTDLHARHTQ